MSLIKPFAFNQRKIVSVAPPAAPANLYINGYNFYKYDGTQLGSTGAGGVAKISPLGVLDTSWATNANPSGQTNQVRFGAPLDGYYYADVRTTNSSTRGFRKIDLSTGNVSSTVSTASGTIWFVTADVNSSSYVFITGDTTISFNGSSVVGIGKIDTTTLTRDSTFATNIGTGPNGFTAGCSLTPTQIAVTGNFTNWDGDTAYERFVVLNHDGTRDTSFTRSGAFNGNTSRSLFLDGKWFVTGAFTTYNGVTNNRLVCFNSDGSVDTTFTTNLGTGFNSSTLNIKKLTNTSFIVTGAFTTLNGNSAPRIAVVNTDGTPVSNVFGTGLNGTTDVAIDYVNELIYIAGTDTTLTSYNGTSTNNIISINFDGTLNTSFVYGNGMQTSTSGVASAGNLWTI